MDKLKTTLFVAGLILVAILVSCNGSEEFLEYKILNQTSGDVIFGSYNNGHSSEVGIGINRTELTGGGGILDIDSVFFSRVDQQDTVIFRNEQHGDDIQTINHFFNYLNWVKKSEYRYIYTLTDDDFQ